MLTKPDFEIENLLSNQYNFIAGVDEAGRGPLAGPVVAAAVILPKVELEYLEINDSKILNSNKREQLYSKIFEIALSVGVCFVHNDEIDKINILQATQKAMHKAIDNLLIKPDYLLIDGNYFKSNGIEHKTIVSGDAKSISIAAASIIAKVERDKWMSEIAHKKYEAFGFDSHKGYPTKKHYDAIEQNGICEFHRKSFLKKYFEKKTQLF